MELSEQAIKEFKEIYKKEFKEEIDDSTARILARRLLNLYKAVYEPKIKNSYEI
jgi:hypothetical protein